MILTGIICGCEEIGQKDPEINDNTSQVMVSTDTIVPIFRVPISTQPGSPYPCLKI